MSQKHFKKSRNTETHTLRKTDGDINKLWLYRSIFIIINRRWKMWPPPHILWHWGRVLRKRWNRGVAQNEFKKPCSQTLTHHNFYSSRTGFTHRKTLLCALWRCVAHFLTCPCCNPPSLLCGSQLSRDSDLRILHPILLLSWAPTGGTRGDSSTFRPLLT